MKKYALFALILLALIGCQTTDKDANQDVVYEYGIPVDSFNIVKGLIISLIVFFIYKPLSNLIRSIDKMFMKK